MRALAPRDGCQVGAEMMRPHVETVLRQLIPIINRHAGQMLSPCPSTAVIPIRSISCCRHESMNKSLLENTAITLGRLCLVAPELAATVLASFMHSWCIALRSIRDDIEKEHAFRGLVRVIRLNPHATLNALLPLCDAFASWQKPPVTKQRAPAPEAPSHALAGVVKLGRITWWQAELCEHFRLILEGYKSSVPTEHFATFCASMPDDLKRRLTARYNL